MDNNNNNSGLKEQSLNAPMDQVREILFGAQLKDMELRFKRQEDRFLREISDVKESLRKRLDSLENFMKSEVSSMLERLQREQQEREASQKAEQRERAEALKNEQRERVEAFKNEERQRIDAVKAEEKERQDAISQLTGDLLNTAENIERKITSLGSTIDSVERELRSLLLNESGSLTDKLETKYADALNVVAKTAAQIRSDMVYRSSLTGLFAEMVGSLSKPWNDEEDLLKAEARSEVEEEPAPDHDDDDEMENQAENGLPQIVCVGSADNY